jgi:hypothetical protein
VTWPELTPTIADTHATGVVGLVERATDDLEDVLIRRRAHRAAPPADAYDRGEREGTEARGHGSDQPAAGHGGQR